MKALLQAARIAMFPPNGKLRSISYCLYHGCNLAGQCTFCQVPFHKVIDPSSGKEKIMTRLERQECLRRLRLVSVPGALINVLGGEPTLRPELLLEAVEDAASFGFLVNVVTNGYALTPELIVKLARAGLHHLAISVDCDGGPRHELDKALKLHQSTIANGIIPVINVIVGSDTDPGDLKDFCQKVFGKKCFISLLVMSPSVGGMFSNADTSAVPSNQQLREIVQWLAWKKAVTGLVTSSFSYLWTLHKSGTFDDGHMNLWHCSSHFRGVEGPGRGFLYIDSDGTIGPCQEFRSSQNILTIPEDRLTLSDIDQDLSVLTTQCEHCIYNCYVMEETIGGAKALAELSTLVRFTRIKRAAPRRRPY